MFEIENNKIELLNLLVNCVDLEYSYFDSIFEGE